jgi:hypothetical protein
MFRQWKLVFAIGAAYTEIVALDDRASMNYVSGAPCYRTGARLSQPQRFGSHMMLNSKVHLQSRLEDTEIAFWLPL